MFSLSHNVFIYKDKPYFGLAVSKSLAPDSLYVGKGVRFANSQFSKWPAPDSLYVGKGV